MIQVVPIRYAVVRSIRTSDASQRGLLAVQSWCIRARSVFVTRHPRPRGERRQKSVDLNGTRDWSVACIGAGSPTEASSGGQKERIFDNVMEPESSFEISRTVRTARGLQHILMCACVCVCVSRMPRASCVSSTPGTLCAVQRIAQHSKLSQTYASCQYVYHIPLVY